jgi:ferredoxin
MHGLRAFVHDRIFHLNKIPDVRPRTNVRARPKTRERPDLRRGSDVALVDDRVRANRDAVIDAPVAQNASRPDPATRADARRAKELHAAGTITQLLGWEAGVLPAYPVSALLTDASRFDALVYDRFCTANVSKRLMEVSKEADTKTLVFLRPCDAHSCARLLAENQINRARVYIIGVGCEGCADVHEGEEHGLLEACRMCDKKDFPVFDELLDAEAPPRALPGAADRFEPVQAVEAMDTAARYAFWQQHLARCIRCNACRNSCPTCHCKVCVLDENNALERQTFHVVRAIHQSGRCTDCGQCARVCPQKIPLHLLNRKLIKDAPTQEE